MSKWMEDNASTLKGVAWGIAIGFVVTLFVGFKWGGWYTTSGAQEFAKNTADTAVQTALAPVCAAEFMRLPDAQAQLVVLKKKEGYYRGEMIGKLIKIPGQGELSSDLSSTCADKVLSSLKTAEAKK